jgi:phage shock protein PspC (stress-responsive transcriptional regulator)
MAAAREWRDDGHVNETAGLRHDRDPDRQRVRRHGLLSRARGPGTGGPLRRARAGRLVGGVAAGLAARTGFDVNVVRLVFVLAVVMSGGGFGAAAYVVAWLLIPADGAEASIASQARNDRRAWC